MIPTQLGYATATTYTRFNLVIEKLMIPTLDSFRDFDFTILFQSRNRETYDSNQQQCVNIKRFIKQFQSRNRETYDSNPKETASDIKILTTVSIS